ncbi:MAG: chemotaxis protein CheW [Cyanobacteria bacterium J06639_1]
MESTAERYIAFKVSGYLLALPVDAVLKVIACPPELRSNLQQVGLAQMGSRTLTVLNLHSLFSDRPTSGGQFLLIAKSDRGDLCGITTDDPPNMIEIDSEDLRDTTHFRLPERWKPWFNGVATLSGNNTSTTILMFDLDRAIQAETASFSPQLALAAS